MLAKERMDLICKMLRINGAVTTGQLSREIGVSVETVRRDLLALERENHLLRVHGGAVLNGESVIPIPLPVRMEQNRDKKQLLSEAACSLIDEGESIAIDSGSTAVEFAAVLARKFKSLTVVTHSSDVFSFLQANSSFELILIGGVYSREACAFFGHITEDAISSMHFNKSFIMPAALSLKNGIGDCTDRSVKIQRIMIERSDAAFAMADSDKFEKNALYSVAPLSPGIALITDSGLPSEIAQLYEENKIKIIIGNGETSK